MSKPTYSELLRDPRWQRKRLEVMGRADFRCEECGDGSRTLNVHHRWYDDGSMPWDYPNHCFVCLCEPCHESKHYLGGDYEANRPRRADTLETQFLQIILTKPSLIPQAISAVGVLEIRSPSVRRAISEVYRLHHSGDLAASKLCFALARYPGISSQVAELIFIGRSFEPVKIDGYFASIIKAFANRPQREALRAKLEKIGSDDDAALVILRQLQELW